MSIIPEFYKNAVVCIGIKNTTDITWIGTGFFVIRELDSDNGIPYLISNKHVFSNSKQIVIRMKERDVDNWKDVDAYLYDDNDNAIFVTHSDKDIDIAVLPLSAKYINENNLEFPAFDIDKKALTSSELRTKGVDDGSTIYMLGFPMQLITKMTSHPICRLGCVARISKDQIDETKNILVDIQNFPGNSGSPIINRPEIVSIEGTPALNESVLIGIVHSYLPYQERLLSAQSNKIVEIREENSGLAFAHPVEYIRDIINTINPLHPNKM